MSFDPEKVYPSVSVGVGTGQFVEHFDVDMEAIRNHLVNGGLTDQQIGRISINFSDQSAPTNRVGRSLHKTVGNHNSITHQINVWPEDHLIAAQATGLEAFDTACGSKIGQTLTHELEHAVASQDSRQRLRNNLFRAKEQAKLMSFGLFTFVEVSNAPLLSKPLMELAGFASSILLANVIAGNSRYKNRLYRRNPEEKRCRTAEQYSPDDLVTIRSREHPGSFGNILGTLKDLGIMPDIEFVFEAGKISIADKREDENTPDNRR